MFVRKTRANCLHVDYLLNLWSEFNVANLNKVTKNVYKLLPHVFKLFSPFFVNLKWLLTFLKLSESMIVIL